MTVDTPEKTPKEIAGHTPLGKTVQAERRRLFDFIRRRIRDERDAEDILLRGWSPWRHRNGWRHDRWKKRFEGKLAAMTPEERQQFQEEWKRRCGWDPGLHGEPDKESATGKEPV